MKTNILQILERPRGAWTALTTLLLVLGSTNPASASWTVANVKTAWDGFNSRFEVGTGAGMYDAQVNDHSGTTGNFWKDAELIEMTEDAYYWLGANGYANAAVKTQINNLCTAFTTKYNAKYGSDWDGNTFSDDLMWATLAFTRAYQIDTTKTQWRTRATSTYDLVWSRNSNVRSNGLNQQKGLSDPQANVNYAAVIAGYLLVANGASSIYQTHADDVWYYAVTTGNLYNNNTGDSAYGKVWDSPGSHSDYSFNYGIAIQAAVRQGDKPTCQAMVSYLENKAFGGNYPFNGTYTYNGVSYRILPNYNNWSDNTHTNLSGDYVGFNGICMRGVGFANSRGYLASSQLPWALANVAAAQREYNDTTYRLIWTDWQNQTPDDGTAYSWSCSSALSAMFDLPMP